MRQPPPSPSEIQPLFHHLEIVRLIGKGGMGAVYEAKQLGLNRRVALKLLWAKPILEASFEERFIREGEALAKLDHENIVSVHDAGHTGPYYWIVMEYVDGPSLRQVMQGGPLSPERALEVVLQICTALQFAHDNGIVHRDIKPENVLLTKAGRVKVADFGLAKVLGVGAPGPKLTGSLHAMGTPHYMAPEQVETPRKVDHRADIYSLGVVMYEALTGELPLGQFAMPSQKVEVDGRIDDVVSKTLQREPERRYQAAAELKQDVQRISTTISVSGKQEDRRWGSWVTYAAVVVLALAVSAIFWLRQDTPSGSADVEARTTAPVVTLESVKLMMRDSSRIVEVNTALEELHAADAQNQEVTRLLATTLQARCRTALDKGDFVDALVYSHRCRDIAPEVTADVPHEEIEARALRSIEKGLRIESPVEKQLFNTHSVTMRGVVDGEAGRYALSVSNHPLDVQFGRFSHEMPNQLDGWNECGIDVEVARGVVVRVRRSFCVDTTPPEITIHSPREGQVVQGEVTVSGSIDEKNLDTFIVNEKSVEVSPTGTWSVQLSLPDGANHIEAMAKDKAGLSASKRVTIGVDAVKPTIGLVDGSSISFGPNRPFIEVPTADNRMVKSVTWLGKTIVPTESGVVRLSYEMDGVHPRNSEQRAVVGDEAGNETAVRVKCVWDDRGPTMRLDPLENTVLSNSKVVIKGRVDENTPCEVEVAGLGIKNTKVNTSEDGTFSVEVDIGDRVDDEPVAVRLLARDAARNIGPQTNLNFVTVPPCTNCLVDGHPTGLCKECGGRGQVDKQCGTCGGSQNTRAMCEKCRGHRGAPCSTCSHTGYLPRRICPKCNGKEWVKCDKCGGKSVRTVLCHWCLGSGKAPSTALTCDHCRGSGRIEEKCTACDENGERRCECLDGHIEPECPDCSDGYRMDVHCDGCEGRGFNQMPCEACKASGVVQDACPKKCDKGRCRTCHGSMKQATRPAKPATTPVQAGTK